MPFRASFDCLWCGRPHSVRGPGDLEGWAQLCPDCLGRAGDNAFLRSRLRAALDERAAAGGEGSAAAPVHRTGATSDLLVVPAVADLAATPAAPDTADWDPDAEMRRYYAARAGEYDDWYLRRGRYSRGPVHDLAWQADLESAADWLDSQVIGPEIVELAAGTGWWSPILARKGELWLYDAVAEPLERARERLLAHGLRAHLHLRDAWAEPDREVDTVFAGFWLSQVPRPRLAEFLGVVRRWLRPGGTFLFIDSRPDPQSGAADQPVAVEPDVSPRRLADGREYRIPKVFYEVDDLREALRAAGFETAEVATTARFFLLGRAAT